MIRLNINSESPEQEKENQQKDNNTSAPGLSEQEEKVLAQLLNLSKEELAKKLLEEEKRYLYLRADFENYRRNVEKERKEMMEKGKEEVLLDLFKILELLDRAIQSAREQNIAPSVLEGLELVRRETEKILEKHQVERIPSLGEKFNPEVHEAVGTHHSEEHEPGTIIYEYEPGFTRQGKLLKPAKVIVAKERKEAEDPAG